MIAVEEKEAKKEKVKEIKKEVSKEKAAPSDIQVKIKKLPSCQVELEVQASAALVQKAQEKAIKEVAKKVSLPGFRKGKAPKEIILKNHQGEVEKEWQKEIADLAFTDVQTQTKLFPISSSSINFKLKKHSLEGAELFFKYETEPQVPTIDPKTVKLKEIPKRTVTEKETEEAVRQTRFYFASFKEVSREIKEGDYVIIDLDALDVEPHARVFSDTRFEVKKKAIADWMIDLLLKAKKGDVIEGLSYPDPEISAEEKKQFEPKKVRLTIKKVEEATLPAIDDNLAKKMGAENVEKMREKITGLLQQNLSDHEHTQYREQLSEYLFTNHPFELPLSLVTSELKHRKDQLLSNQNFKAKYDKMKIEEKAKIEADLKRNSEKAIALFYLSRKIVHDHKLDITKEEIMKLIGQENPQQKITQEMYALTLSRLILNKAEEFILNNRQS